MQNPQRSDAVDPRLLYWTYAGAAWLGGFVVLNWGPHWTGFDLPGRPFGLAALIRMLGAFIIAGGCFAASLATAEDAVARRRARTWFLAANIVVFAMFILQQHAVWGGGAVEYAAELLFIVVLFGVLVGAEEAGVGTHDMITLFGRTPRRPSTQQLRSRYERQIREAASQQERNRLARELHDSIKQQLFVVQAAAATVQARWDQDAAGARSALDQVRASARDAMTEMEVMLDQLRATPIENVGLVEALKKQCEALGLRTGARVSFDVGSLPAASRLAPGSQQAIFRVAQEAMTNIARHARAQNVRVMLGGASDEVRLVVEDDGAGFDLDSTAQGLGLASMRERADEFGGELTARSQPGRGTTISLVMPCPPASLGVPDYRMQARMWAVLLSCQVVLGTLDAHLFIAALIPAGFLARSLGRLRRQRHAKQAHI